MKMEVTGFSETSELILHGVRTQNTIIFGSIRRDNLKHYSVYKENICQALDMAIDKNHDLGGGREIMAHFQFRRNSEYTAPSVQICTYTKLQYRHFPTDIHPSCGFT
jgi:hypothetical protein